MTRILVFPPVHALHSQVTVLVIALRHSRCFLTSKIHQGIDENKTNFMYMSVRDHSLALALLVNIWVVMQRHTSAGER